MEFNLKTQEFIQKASLIHNYKFNYDKTFYIHSKTKICITCPEHGDFWQIPDIHIRGSDCPICHKNKDKLTLEQFIEKAKVVHSGKYRYDKVEYINSYTKIIITCPEHGDFNQQPANHLFGHGCKKCFLKSKNLTTDQFIEKANIIHNGKYIYSKTNYINSKTKVIITCPEHGDFEQKANGHLNGHGCNMCNPSKGELAIKEILSKYNIKTISQYHLPEIVSNYKYDFYLPDYRILIEFHGVQHYKYIPFLHNYDEDNFDKQKERDLFKKDFAHRFKYRFLEFNYKQLKYMSKEQFEEFVIRFIKH